MQTRDVDDDALEERLDTLTTALLLPLRAEKRVDPESMALLLTLGDDLLQAVADRPFVSKALVGKAWFVFTSLLAEADHARDPEPILDAWSWAEKLRSVYGPHL